ncbi:MAG: hypothetical protein Q9168_000837 [Polycauliona sp. 1 TL-2023]
MANQHTPNDSRTATRPFSFTGGIGPLVGNPRPISTEAMFPAPPLRKVTAALNALAAEDKRISATDGAEDALAGPMAQLQLATDPGIMRLAVETRLDIYRVFITPNRYKFCPHVRLPLLISSPRIGLPFTHHREPVPCLNAPTKCGYSNLSSGGKGPHRECLESYLKSHIHFAPVNKLGFTLLQVCQRFHAEALDLFYSENVFYFEQCLTLTLNKTLGRPVTRLKLPQHLLNIPPHRRRMVKKIAFSVTDESVIDHGFVVWQLLCHWIIKNLPNLQHTYIFLFDNRTSSSAGQMGGKVPLTRPSDRFLVKTIDFLDTIPGHKTIEFRGSNKNKRIVGNILAPYFRNNRKKDQTISVIGGCNCQCWAPHENHEKPIRGLGFR